MNCTICKKPVDEHREGRETDRCVAEKLGYEVSDTDEWVYELKGYLPHYSSPIMSAEIWGLVERMKEDIENIIPQSSDWMITLYNGREREIYVFAPTPTLAICRAFLTKENPCTK